MKSFRSIIAAAALSLLAAGHAAAQSSPGLTYGQVPTASQWNGYFAAKQDVLGFAPLPATGGTMTGRLVTPASTTNLSGFNMTPGGTPANPANGDMWTTASGLFVRINGVTTGPLSGAGTFNATAPLTASTTGGTTTYACPTCGVTTSPLSQFASTTSAQLAGIISNETGSGALVFGTSPTITGATIGSPIITLDNNVSLRWLNLSATPVKMVKYDGGGSLVFGEDIGAGGTYFYGSSVAPIGSGVTSLGLSSAAWLSVYSFNVVMPGTTSGFGTLKPPAVASSYTWTLPSATGTLITADVTKTLTNTTYDTAGTGNSFSINGVAATSNTGTGAVVRAASPTVASPTFTSSFTATGLVGLSNLASQSANTVLAAATAGSPTAMAVPSCSTSASALQWVTGTGLQCGTIVASAASVTVGTTDVLGGTTLGLLFNNGTKLGNLATANSGVLVTSGSGVPSISTTLPSGLGLGTPASVNLSNATALPASALTGLSSGLPAFFASATSANFAAALTNETGTGFVVFSDSPALTGSPTAPTATLGTANTLIATTQFVANAVAAATAGVATLNGQTGNVVGYYATQGRITLVSGVALPTSDVAGAPTMFFTPFKGDMVPLFDGTYVVPTSFPEVSQAASDTTKSPSATAANAVYPIFCWLDSSTKRCTRGPAWSSDTVVGTGAGSAEITYVKGIPLNAYAVTNGPAAQRGTLVGCVRTNASGQFMDTAAFRWVSNVTTSQPRPMKVVEPTASWNYAPSPAAFQQARNNAANQLDFLQCLAGGQVTASVRSLATNTLNSTIQSVGIDIDTLNTSNVVNNLAAWNLQNTGQYGMIGADYNDFPGQGRHIAIWKEYTSSGTATFFSGGTTYMSGIYGTVWN